MKTVHALLIVLLLSSGCLAQTYPGVVVGNPDTEEPPAPGKPGENETGEFPDPQQGPDLFDPESPTGDPAAPGPIQKNPDDPRTYESEDEDLPGGDRIGESPNDETPEVPTPPMPSRQDHADFGQEAEFLFEMK